MDQNSKFYSIQKLEKKSKIGSEYEAKFQNWIKIQRTKFHFWVRVKSGTKTKLDSKMEQKLGLGNVSLKNLGKDN